MEFLTAEQVAVRLGITPRRVQAMAQSGRLPASRFGRSLMIKESDLALVAGRKRGRPPKAEGEDAKQAAAAQADVEQAKNQKASKAAALAEKATKRKAQKAGEKKSAKKLKYAV